MEANLMTEAMLFALFGLLTILHLTWMTVLDPVAAIASVHETLASRFGINHAVAVNSAEGVYSYIDEFTQATYRMASAMVDTNTLVNVDLDRCLSEEVTDVCRLDYWAFPGVDSPAFVNRTALQQDTLSPLNVPSTLDCDQQNPVADCVNRTIGSLNMDPTAKYKALGLTPEDAIILSSRHAFSKSSVVALSPLVYTIRAPRAPCSGFGYEYNFDVLGAGSCERNVSCDPSRVTKLQSARPNRRTGRHQSIFLTYEKEAFNCVDRTQQAEEFWDTSWSAWATYQDMTTGSRLQASLMKGSRVFWKFVSDVAQLQAPMRDDIKLDADYCSLWLASRDQTPPPSVRDLCTKTTCTDPLQEADHPMWSEDLGYGAECSLRKAWTTAYMATPIDQRDHVWFSAETTELSVAALVITPQMAGVPELVSVVTVTFETGQYGDVTSATSMATVSVTSQRWFILSGIVASIGVVHAMYSFHLRSTIGRLVYADFLISTLCICHVALAVLVELVTPDLLGNLIQALRTEDQQGYFRTFQQFATKSRYLYWLKSVGFTMIAALFVRFISHFTIHPELATLPLTIQACLRDVLQFFLVLAVIEIFLAWFGFITFGTGADGFSSMRKALWTNSQLFLGVGDPTNGEMPEVLLACYFFIEVVVVVVALMNFLLATVVEAYTRVNERQHSNKAVGAWAADVVDAIRMLHLRRRRRWPSNESVLWALEHAGRDEAEPVTAVELFGLQRVEKRKSGPLFANLQEAQAYARLYAEKVGGRLQHGGGAEAMMSSEASKETNARLYAEKVAGRLQHGVGGPPMVGESPKEGGSTAEHTVSEESDASARDAAGAQAQVEAHGHEESHSVAEAAEPLTLRRGHNVDLGQQDGDEEVLRSEEDAPCMKHHYDEVMQDHLSVLWQMRKEAIQDRAQIVKVQSTMWHQLAALKQQHEAAASDRRNAAEHLAMARQMHAEAARDHREQQVEAERDRQQAAKQLAAFRQMQDEASELREAARSHMKLTLELLQSAREALDEGRSSAQAAPSSPPSRGNSRASMQAVSSSPPPPRVNSLPRAPRLRPP